MIITSRHPDYTANQSNWELYRDIFTSGDDFISKYVEKYHNLESNTDYYARLTMTYCPAHAKAAVLDIKNSIYCRLIDIIRLDGPPSYQQAIQTAVDKDGNTMNSFIGRIILPEMLFMGKVGVFVDKPTIDTTQPQSLADVRNLRPYLYHYPIEDICSWTYNNDNQLTALLLRDHQDSIDENTGLTTDIIEQYRLLRLTDTGVDIIIFDDHGKEIDGYNLSIPIIPFVICEISQSLLTDIAKHQVALVNLASSDIHQAIKSNFPFYVEQFDPLGELGASALKGSQSTDTDVNDKEIALGVNKGRRYPKGLEAPRFINPSSEPLIASMKKQDDIVKEIRLLVNLTVSNLEPVRTSAERKREDDRGLEAGLSYIGLELEHAERQIGYIWSKYEGDIQPPVIHYPQTYSVRTDEDRRVEADELRKLMAILPSQTYQKVIAKQIATITMGHKITDSQLKQIHKEIEAAPVVLTDPEIITQDHEAGFVSTETASKARGYPKGEVEQAKKDHADRAARIALAQSKAGARGVADMDTEPKKSAEDEKEQSQDDSIR